MQLIEWLQQVEVEVEILFNGSFVCCRFENQQLLSIIAPIITHLSR